MLDMKLSAGSAVLARLSGIPGPPTPPPPPAPSWTVPPSITGTAAVGSILTANDGSVTGGAVTGRSWRRDGVAIAGATGGSYTPSAGDAGKTIDLVVSAAGPGGVAQATTPAVGPVAATSAPAPVTRVVIEGDSITSTMPNQTVNHGDFYSYVWKAAHPGVTVSVPAQASRTVGGPAWAGPPMEGDDRGSPAGNTLLDARAADMAGNPQMLTVMIGANDLGTFGVRNTIEKLIAWATPIRQAGVRIAFSPPTPYRDAEPRQPNHAAYTARRAAFLAEVRDPAGWGRFADAYIPMGEHPDFADAALIPQLYGDGVHPSAPVGAAGTGQARLYAVFDAAMATLIDTGRKASVVPFASVWPVDETNLAPGGEVVRRIMLSGIAHAGLADGIAITGSGAQSRVNGGPWGAAGGTVYNGDVIDIRVTTSPTADTAVAYDLRIGGETRRITLRSAAAVTPASYAHGGIRNIQPAAATHSFSALPFAATGTAILFVKGGGTPPDSVSIGGVRATRLFTQSTDGFLELWTLPGIAAGSHDVIVGYAGFHGQTTLSWGVMENADPVPTQVASSAPANQSSPHTTAALSVPSGGIAIAAFGEYGGATIAPATARAGTDFVDEAHGTFQSETHGICIGRRTTSGAAGFDYVFGSHARGAVVFKAAGS